MYLKRRFLYSVNAFLFAWNNFYDEVAVRKEAEKKEKRALTDAMHVVPPADRGIVMRILMPFQEVPTPAEVGKFMGVVAEIHPNDFDHAMNLVQMACKSYYRVSTHPDLLAWSAKNRAKVEAWQEKRFAARNAEAQAT